jgi:hypothetical protein
LMSPAPLVSSSPFGLRVADAPSPPFRTSYKPVSRELTPTGTSAHSRQPVKLDYFRVADEPEIERIGRKRVGRPPCYLLAPCMRAR